MSETNVDPAQSFGVCCPLVAGRTDSTPVKEFESSEVENHGGVRLAETKVPAH